MQQKLNFPYAVAVIHGSNAFSDIKGQVLFFQEKNCVLVEAIIDGLPTTDTGFFGFHIHTGESCTGTDFADTNGHYNPAKTEHPLHAGDLPPLLSCNKKAYLAVATNRFNIKDILGKTVVIHNMPDDFHSQPAGNAGTKIACGKIHKA